MMLHSSNKKSGFTLIEMMVAVTLFVVVALITSASILAMSAARRQIENQKFLIENVGLALDSISFKAQQIAPGTKYVCLTNTTSFSQAQLSSGVECPPGSGGDVLVFRYKSPLGATTDYAYALGPADALGRSSIVYKKGSPNLSDLNGMQALTAPQVDIKKLQFVVSNPSGIRGRVTTLIESQVRDRGGSVTTFRLQRTIAP